MDVNTFYEIVDRAKKYDALKLFPKQKELNCSFCGKSQSQVKRLVAGERAMICDECVSICNEVLSEEQEKETES